MGDGLVYSVSISTNSGAIAKGAYGNDGNGSDSGHVRIYDLNSVSSVNSFKVDLSSIYPNPATTEIFITLKNDLQLLKVNLYNVMGQFVKQSKTNKIDVSTLSSGLYIVEIETNQGKGSKKVLL